MNSTNTTVKKLEIGGQRCMEGWDNLGVRDNDFDIIVDDIPYTNLSYIYWSHVIEHIPFICVGNILEKMFNALSDGGCLRTVCPDMKSICKAYLNNDVDAFTSDKNHWSSFDNEYSDCGISGMFIAQFVNSQSPGSRDENHVTNKKGDRISDLSHVMGYDFNILKTVLNKAGFIGVRKTPLIGIDPHPRDGQLLVDAFKSSHNFKINKQREQRFKPTKLKKTDEQIKANREWLRKDAALNIVVFLKAKPVSVEI